MGHATLTVTATGNRLEAAGELQEDGQGASSRQARRMMPQIPAEA